jgi:putative transposase
LLKISKATYYNCEEPTERFLKKYNWVKKAVRKIIKDNSNYGVRRIHKSLKNENITIGRDQLGELLKLWGLELKRKIKKPKISIIRKILIKLSDKANLLIRVKLTRPLQAVSSDITEVLYNDGKAKLYICFHKDVFGQMIYGFSVSENMDVTLVLESLKKAIKTMKKLTKDLSKIVFHQDQGSQYTSYRYISAILNTGKISFSKKGTPTDNAGQESAIGKFKDEREEEIYETEKKQEVEKLIFSWAKYYNKRRIHTSIGYQTPEKFTKSYALN